MYFRVGEGWISPISDWIRRTASLFSAVTSLSRCFEYVIVS
jgi:hypothetical protein